jgi:MoaD family protein
MRVVIHYLAQVKQAAGAASETVEIDSGATVQELVRQLADRQGDSLRRLLFDSSNQLSASILLFAGDEQVRWETTRPLTDGDELSILAPMAGG